MCRTLFDLNMLNVGKGHITRLILKIVQHIIDDHDCIFFGPDVRGHLLCIFLSINDHFDLRAIQSLSHCPDLVCEEIR